MRVLILHDEVVGSARKDEQDVLVQAEVVRSSLRELGHDVSSLGFGLDLHAAAEGIRAARPDAVFNLVESVAGTGRLIHLAPSLLDTLGVPYTGAPTEAIFQTSGKLGAKQALRSAGLATPRWYSLHDLRCGTPVPAGRYIVKSVWEHASVGLDEGSVVEVEDGDGLRREVERRLDALLGEGFAEAYIEGREFNLALLAGGDDEEQGEARCRVLPPAEIVFQGYGEGKARVVGYRAKWEEGSFEYENTPRRFDFGAGDRPLLWEMQRLARACWGLFGLRGYARVDFRVDQTGRPWILEVNTNPCLSPDAGYAAALERAGIGLTAAIGRILSDAGCRG